MQLESAELTSSGRLVLRPGEFEKGLLDHVDLDNVQLPARAPQNAYKLGDCILTNLRLVWRGGVGSPAAGTAVGLPLAAVHRVRKDAGFGFAAKVKLELTVAVDDQSRPLPGSADLTKLTLKTKGTGVDTFKTTLDTLLSTRSWQLPPPIHPTPPSHPIPTTSIDASSSAASPTTSADGTSATPAPGPHQWQPLHQHQLHGAGWRPASQSSPPAAAQPPAFNMSLVRQLRDMGFSRNKCIRAVQATNSASLQAALDFLLAYGDQPGLDDPLPPATHAPDHSPPHHAHARQDYNSPPNAYPQPSHTYPSPYPQHPTSAVHSSSWGGGGLPPSDPVGVQNPLLQQLQPPRPAQQLPQRPPASTGAVGVGALLQKQAQQQAETSKSLETAFRDLGALMAMAQQMVALAEKFRGVAGADGGTAGGDLVDLATQQELVALGIPSPVTRESAGAKYHEELARQLADFLLTPPPAAPPGRNPTPAAAPLPRAGGVLPLPDVYCLFNRARGSELVSPDDLLQCAALFPRLGIGLQLRRFASGVIVLQTAAHSDAQVAARIAELARPPHAADAQPDGAGPTTAPRGSVPGLGPPLTASDVARAMGVPLTIAAEHLATAEQLGAVCRDNGPEGLRYFRNFFKEVRPVAV